GSVAAIAGEAVAGSASASSRKSKDAPTVIDPHNVVIRVRNADQSAKAGRDGRRVGEVRIQRRGSILGGATIAAARLGSNRGRPGDLAGKIEANAPDPVVARVRDQQGRCSDVDALRIVERRLIRGYAITTVTRDAAHDSDRRAGMR